MHSLTRILERIDSGDPHAAAELLPLVYEDLRRLAKLRLRREGPGLTLQGTALVHEAWMRLQTDGAVESPRRWESRGHFFAAAAEAMRRILVEQARRRERLKHGGEFERQSLDDIVLELPEGREDLLALDEALGKLAATDKAAADLIQLRYFAGLSAPEAAEALRLAPRTADRLWAYARAWLKRELCGADDF